MPITSANRLSATTCQAPLTSESPATASTAAPVCLPPETPAAPVCALPPAPAATQAAPVSAGHAAASASIAPRASVAARTPAPRSSIRSLQLDLVTLGYNVGPTGADGIWGPKSSAAMRQFQRAHNVAPSGRPDSTARQSLSSRVQALQSRLVATYPWLDSSFVDGKAGPNTIAALSRYQQDHNLAPTGRLDGPTRALLFAKAPAAAAKAPADTVPASPNVTASTPAGQLTLTNLYTERLNLVDLYRVYQGQHDAANSQRVLNEIEAVDARLRAFAG